MFSYFCTASGQSIREENIIQNIKHTKTLSEAMASLLSERGDLEVR
jgi:hypothetical protein